MTGRLTRADLAQTVVACLNSPYASFKTLEIRRDENEDAMEQATDFDGIFRVSRQGLDCLSTFDNV